MFWLKILFLISLAVGNAASISQDDDEVQELKDLLVSSVQNVVALNTLVTSQTQQISELKMEIIDMGTRYNLALRKIEETIGGLKTEIQDQEDHQDDMLQQQADKLQHQQDKIEGLEETIGSLKTEIQDQENHQDDMLQQQEDKLQHQQDKIEGFEETIGSLKTEIQDQEDHQDDMLQEQDDKLQQQEDKLQELLEAGNPVTVLNGEEENGSSKCAKVCSGTTGRTSSNWITYGSTGDIYITVDISGCGFAKIPTITTALEGSWDRSTRVAVTGTSSVYYASSSQFQVYIHNINSNRGTSINNIALTRGWNIEWIAVGFTC